MFSVNNFYDILNSHYGYPKTNTLFKVFKPHGSKDLHDLTYWVDLNGPLAEARLQGQVICNDQEPVSVAAFDTYRDSMVVDKKMFQCLRHLSTEAHKEFVDTMSVTNKFSFYHLLQKYCRMPIICHSERNSDDIAQLSSHHFIECYYWWHGMVARDWFRHWEHHGDLGISNKASVENRFLLYARATDGTRQYRQDIIDHFKDRYGWEESSADSSFSATIDISDANCYAVHVVAETLFDTNKIYLTEKVFKPMVMSQPFILFAPPGSLQYLRDYGFRTFSDIWSEDYDLITDHACRKREILSLIDHLAAMSREEFYTLYQKTLPIITHNRDRFFSVAFQQDLMREMHTNFDCAMHRREEHYKMAPGDPWCYYLEQTASLKPLPNNWGQWLLQTIAIAPEITATVNKYPLLRSLI